MNQVASVSDLISNYMEIRRRLYPIPKRNRWRTPRMWELTASKPPPPPPPLPAPPEKIAREPELPEDDDTVLWGPRLPAELLKRIDKKKNDIETLFVLVEVYVALKSHMKGMSAALRASCLVFGCSKEKMLSGPRTQPLVTHRQIAMCLASVVNGHSMPQVGKAFDRDHTTVLHAVRKWSDLFVEPLQAYGVVMTRPPTVRRKPRNLKLIANYTPSRPCAKHRHCVPHPARGVEQR
jgi:hypothetical protein